MDEHLNIGTDVTVSIQDGKELEGVIVWSRSIEDHAGLYTGVKFKEPPDVINEKIHRMMEI